MADETPEQARARREAVSHALHGRVVHECIVAQEMAEAHGVARERARAEARVAELEGWLGRAQDQLSDYITYNCRLRTAMHEIVETNEGKVHMRAVAHAALTPQEDSDE